MIGRTFAAGFGFVAASLVSTAAPVQAATVIPAVFNFSSSNANNNVSDGNARIFTATSSQLGTYRVRVTGWSLEKVGSTTYVRDSKLQMWDGGLGVTSGDDGDGSSNRHTIDNSVRKDFLLLQFDRNVKLTTATFNTFSVLGGTKDSDATLKYGVTALPWNGGLNLNDKTESVLNAMFSGSYSSLASNGNSNTRNINPDLNFGNFWLIGANFTNADGKIDGFKLANLAVIPEPGSWAMMIGGLGLAGMAVRRRKAAQQALA